MVAKASEETPFSKLLHEIRGRIIRISISVIIVMLHMYDHESYYD